MCKKLCEQWKGRGEERGGSSATWKFYPDIPAGFFFVERGGEGRGF